jgi:hypothetical protein
MASIRCPNCNFLNFATEQSCKKCRQPIGAFVPEAAPAGYGTSNFQPAHTNPSAFQYSQPPQQAPQPATSYYTPPPPNFYDELRSGHPAPPVRNDYVRTFTVSIPPVCVKCGGASDLSMQNFKKDYTPPIAYIGIFGGILPLLVLVLVLRKQHKLNGLFCPECWDKFKHYSLFSNLFGLSVLGLLFGGLIFAIAANNPYIGLFGFIAAVMIGIFGNYYSRKISPKFVKMNRKQIYIKIPNYGEIDFTHSAL